MLVFISHSFDNKAQFENVALALNYAGVPYWDPADVQIGTSLRAQLRDAVERCGVCVFVATHKSIQSSWCGAELGAFWGAGKPIIVYVADAGLQDHELPQIVQGDVWEQSLSQIAARAKELLENPESALGRHDTRPPPPTGIVISIKQLEDVVKGAVALAIATTKSDSHAATQEEINQAAQEASGAIIRGAQATDNLSAQPERDWQRHILWVDDRPDNNIYERQAFETFGLEFTLALSTREALDILVERRFAAIISDMGRREGPQEGYVLLRAIRGKDQETPFFIYAGSNAPEHKRLALSRGAQGCTNSPHELIDMVTQVLGNERLGQR